MTIEKYIDNINQRYKLGNATEHTFRGDLQQLLESLVPEIRTTNEPKRQSCGAPDYILTKKDIPVGFIEAKDIGDKDLDGTKKTGNKEQFDRYKASLNNLIFTDYINFHLYREGEFIAKIAIAEITEKGIKPLPENFGNFENLIKDFCVHVGQTIKSSKKLAEMMAGKARLLSDIIGKALSSDEENKEDSTLKDQMLACAARADHRRRRRSRRRGPADRCPLSHPGRGRADALAAGHRRTLRGPVPLPAGQPPGRQRAARGRRRGGAA